MCVSPGRDPLRDRTIRKSDACTVTYLEDNVLVFLVAALLSRIMADSGQLGKRLSAKGLGKSGLKLRWGLIRDLQVSWHIGTLRGECGAEININAGKFFGFKTDTDLKLRFLAQTRGCRNRQLLENRKGEQTGCTGRNKQSSQTRTGRDPTIHQKPRWPINHTCSGHRSAATQRSLQTISQYCSRVGWWQDHARRQSVRRPATTVSGKRYRGRWPTSPTEAM